MLRSLKRFCALIGAIVVTLIALLFLARQETEKHMANCERLGIACDPPRSRMLIDVFWTRLGDALKQAR